MKKEKAIKNERLYIAYGSNLNLPQMRWRCPTANVIGSGEVKDYELLFRGNRLGAVATIEPLDDRYEGYPNFYRKEMMDVEVNGECVTAMVYVMNDGYEFGSPSDSYLNTIAAGYQSAGFDLDVLDQAVEKSIQLAQEQTGQQMKPGSIWEQGW